MTTTFFQQIEKMHIFKEHTIQGVAGMVNGYKITPNFMQTNTVPKMVNEHQIVTVCETFNQPFEVGFKVISRSALMHTHGDRMVSQHTNMKNFLHFVFS
jgi:hypothetical protein